MEWMVSGLNQVVAHSGPKAIAFIDADSGVGDSVHRNVRKLCSAPILFFPLSMQRSSRAGLGAALTVLYVLLCAFALLLVRADPGRVVEWWFD